MKLAAIIALFLTILFSAGDGRAGEEIPLPEDLFILQPDPDVPPEFAKFSGAWGEGRWNGQMPHILVVEEVEKDGSVVIIYAYPDWPDWNISGKWHRLQGKIERGKLRAQFASGVRITYKYKSNGSLSGRHIRSNNRISKIKLFPITIGQSD